MISIDYNRLLYALSLCIGRNNMKNDGVSSYFGTYH